MTRLVVASYNIHRCRGLDARVDVARVVAVLREIGADIYGLQEVCGGASGGGDQFHGLAEATGFHATPGLTLLTDRGPYGNALLSREPPLEVTRLDLSVGRREPRGAILARFAHAGHELRVVTTHFGLKVFDRARQTARLLDAIAGDDTPTVLLGDLNEWLPFAPAGRALRRAFPRQPRPCTFPSWRPCMALDRVLVRPAAWLEELRVHRTALSRIASDHLPVRATLRLAAEPGAAGARGLHAAPD